jgi:GDPmannose 4,6-dehydratase
MKKALITGIAGQDGSYLAELLLGKGYEVHGIELPVLEGNRERLANIQPVLDSLHLHFGSLCEPGLVQALVARVQPDECYHLAAASFVSFAFEDEVSVLQNNLQGTHNLLAALKEKAPACKVFFAGTSEMFGNATTSPQDETTPFLPRSVYGISKAAGHHLVRYYREQHGLYACTGILYNHESPRRGKQFVTRKITSTVAAIKAGKAEKLVLGNLDAFRDWGYAPDFVEAMWLMLQQARPEDFVISSGRLHSVREFVQRAFDCVGLDYQGFVEVDPKFYRPAEEVPLHGNPGKAEEKLAWINRKCFPEIIQEMVGNDLHSLEN